MWRYLFKHKNEENVWFKQLDYKVDHNTTFCVLPFTPGWKAFQRYGGHPYVKVYLIYLTSKGYMLLVRGGEKDDEYAFFTSHLFDRYRERELRDLSMDKREVIKEFFIEKTFASAVKLEFGLLKKSSPNEAKEATVVP